MKLTRKQLIIVHSFLTFLTVSGGLLFTIGSIMFLPSLADIISPYAGGVLFIVGSICFFICDILSAIV